MKSFNLLYSYTLRFSPEDSERVVKDYLDFLDLFKEALPEHNWLVLLRKIKFIVDQENRMILERSLLDYHPLEEIVLQQNEEKYQEEQRKKAIRTMVLVAQVLIGLSGLATIVMNVL